MLNAASGAAAAPLVLLLIVMIVDGAIGGLPGIRAVLGAPLAAIRALTGWFDRRLNRAHRGEGTRRMRGALVAGVVAVLAAGAGAAVLYVAQRYPYGWIAEALALLALFGQRERIDRMRALSRCIALKETDEARRLARPLVRYDTASLDGYGVARAAIEGSMARFVEGCIGTVFWYLMLGLPALCVYRAIGAAADAIGNPSPRHAAFGFVARRLDDVLSLLPAIIAGATMAVAALFVPRSNPAAGLGGWIRDLAARGLRADFRAEGAIAGALGLALGGPRPIGGTTLPVPWIGEGRARATVADVHRAAMLVTIATLLVAAGLALAIVLRTG